MADDDDPAEDWAEAEPTVVMEAPPAALIHDPTTAPHALEELPGFEVGRSRGREEGCKSCYTEGQEDAITALRSLLYEQNYSDSEVKAVVTAVGRRLVKL